MISLSNSPLSTSRRCCLFVRSAAAGTPSTARTGAVSFAFFVTIESRWPISSRTASASFSDASLMSPRSSGRRRSSIVRLSRASLPTSTSRLSIFLATRSAGQPTKLSMTTRSPVDVEMALREVPRSIPTVNTPFASLAAIPRLLVFLSHALMEVRLNPGKQRVRNRLPVTHLTQKLCLVVVRQTGHFSENRGHSRGGEYDEWRRLHAPIFDIGIYPAQIPKQRAV